ncbi:hypothetical protein J3R83DRAFT_7564 [Lanmaoa asiatica]|nr:hypothetical protein J3R83DRAFT_7564 [Lanmaoa asiatica]
MQPTLLVRLRTPPNDSSNVIRVHQLNSRRFLFGDVPSSRGDSGARCDMYTKLTPLSGEELVVIRPRYSPRFRDVHETQFPPIVSFPIGLKHEQGRRENVGKPFHEPVLVWGGFLKDALTFCSFLRHDGGGLSSSVPYVLFLRWLLAGGGAFGRNEQHALDSIFSAPVVCVIKPNFGLIAYSIHTGIGVLTFGTPRSPKLKASDEFPPHPPYRGGLP